MRPENHVEAIMSAAYVALLQYSVGIVMRVNNAVPAAASREIRRGLDVAPVRVVNTASELEQSLHNARVRWLHMICAS